MCNYSEYIYRIKAEWLKSMTSFLQQNYHFWSHTFIPILSFLGIDEKSESSTGDTAKATKHENEDIAARKKRAFTLLEYSRVFPFRWMKNLYFCFYCDDQFKDPADLRRHNSTHSTITPALLRNRNLKKHELIKVDITDVGCKLCDDKMHNFQELKVHLNKKHGIDIDPKSDGVLPFRITKDSFKCALCDTVCCEFKSLNNHMNVHYQNFICEQCGSGFVTPDRLRVHSFSHETGAFKCDAEGCAKVFRSKNNRNEHFAIVHMKRKRHRCPQCSETFINYFQRSKHISSVHGVKLKEFKCKLCPKIFTLSGKLGAHVRTTHLKMKRYSCDVCSWKVYSLTELKQHMIKHLGFRSFQCNICDKAYARSHTLKEHMKMHEDARKHACGACGKTFLQACSLTRHSKTHVRKS